MADKTVKMTAPNGAAVEVAGSKVENLLRRGFAEAEKKAPAKKSASSKKSD